MPRRILITGPNGFIGSQVTAYALAQPELDVRLVHHHSAPPAADPTRAQVVHADLSDAATIRGLCRDIDAVIHCASRITGDEESLRQVNDLGTAELVADADRFGVRRFVYLSTAAVYGRGPFHKARPDAPALRPASATSASRAAAEQHVLAAAGTVLRPHLVYGTGDRWVLPGLIQLTRRLRATVSCTSVHSAIEVGALAAAALAAALCEGDVAGAHHVNHPVPLRTSELMALVREHTGTQAGPPLTPQQAHERLAGEPLLRHHLQMLMADHWFDSDPIWQLLALDPGPPPAHGLRQVMQQYQQPAGPPPAQSPHPQSAVPTTQATHDDRWK